MTGRNRNEVWSRIFLDELVRSGVRHVCLAPGSRSTPLVLAAAEREELRLHPFLDERSAAFFALGVGRASAGPAAVITTSGTAVANLFPAVVEASRGEVPLLLLTADRPPRLRGADANQTIDQARIFGDHVRSFVEAGPPDISGPGLRHLRVVAARAAASTVGLPAGPVHVNFPFAKPLEPVPVPGDVPAGLEAAHPTAVSGRPDGAPFTRIVRRTPVMSDDEVEAVALALTEARRPLIVAGPAPEPLRRGPRLRAAARASGAPLLADPLSGARTGREREVPLVVHYDLFLRDPRLRAGLQPDVILRLGGAPTSAALLHLLEEAHGARQIVVDGGDAWKDHLSLASDYLRAEPEPFLDALVGGLEQRWGSRLDDGEGGGGRLAPTAGPAGWGSLWARSDEAAGRAIEDAASGPFFEGVLLREVAGLLPVGAALFVSSSMPVRDLDAYGGASTGGGAVYGNRGASGIDGIVSSALGVSAGLDRLVVAVLGDLAFHHDMNGLLAARREGVRVVFVVIHNDGGGIFQMLPIREYEPAFTPYFATPHGLDFQHAAELYSLPHRRVEGRTARGGSGSDPKGGVGALREALGWALEQEGSSVVEVRTDREENRQRQEAVSARVAEAVRYEAELEGGEGDERG